MHGVKYYSQTEVCVCVCIHTQTCAGTSVHMWIPEKDARYLILSHSAAFSWDQASTRLVTFYLLYSNGATGRHMTMPSLYVGSYTACTLTHWASFPVPVHPFRSKIKRWQQIYSFNRGKYDNKKHLTNYLQIPWDLCPAILLTDPNATDWMRDEMVGKSF